MTALVNELTAIIEPYPYLAGTRSILAACDTRQWPTILRAVKEAMSDPKFMGAAYRARDMQEWWDRANRITRKVAA